jgi:hypothetical protein
MWYIDFEVILGKTIASCARGVFMIRVLMCARWFKLERVSDAWRLTPSLDPHDVDSASKYTWKQDKRM